MTSRRIFLSAVAAFSAMPAIAEKAEKKPFVQDVDYTKVIPTIDYPKRPIIVHDFFAYTCPHCLRFAPYMEDWKSAAAKTTDIKVVTVPVAWEESYNLFPKIYYGFEALGRLHELHMPYWEWVIKEEHPWQTIADARRDTEDWLSKHNINVAEWNKLIDSFVIESKVKQASSIWKMYGIDSTPMVGVAGRYLTAPHLTGTRPRTIEMLNELVHRVRVGK